MSMMCRPKWPFLHMYGSHDMRHVEFRGLTGSQRTPRFWGVTDFLGFHKYIKFLEYRSKKVSTRAINNDAHHKNVR